MWFPLKETCGSQLDFIYGYHLFILQELLKVVYVDKELAFIKDLDISRTMENKENTSYDGKNGVRCIRISPDGKHLASGDRSGNKKDQRCVFKFGVPFLNTFCLKT